MENVPSPNSQAHSSIVPSLSLDPAMKLQLSPAQVGETDVTVGGLLVVVSVHSPGNKKPS